VIERRMRRAAQHSNRAIFVSEPLRQRMAPHWGEKTSLIIPCGAASDLFFFDQSLREKTRRDLGFSDDTTVFVYSGSLVEYQKFPETVAMYRRLAATTRNTRLLVLTKDRKKAAALTGEDPAILIRSAGHSEINGYLNAADVAFMLRDPTAINIVASPTKFAEYGLTGLPVIMSRSVPDSYEFAKQTGSLIDVTDIDAPRSLAIVDRAAVADQFRRRLTKQAQSESYKTLYS
jgi:glycosyltransferase involved in cell wall biosynthesis